ncbi:hypothetical protein GCM10027168_24520 [Streptomyces capparidis]
MGRHSAPGRGRGRQQARAGRAEPEPRLTVAGTGTGETGQGEHARAHEPGTAHGHPEPGHPEPGHPEPGRPPYGQQPGRPQHGRPQQGAPHRPHPGPWAPAPPQARATTHGAGQWDAWHTSPGPRRHSGPDGPRPEDVAAFDRPADGPADPPGPPVPPVPAVPRAEPRPGPEPTPLPVRGPARRTTAARMLTGVLAAAVTAGLAFAVAGQVTGDRDERTAASGETRADDSAASRSQERRQPAGAPPRDGAAVGASLHEQLSVRLPLPADLALSGDFAAVPGKDAAPGGGRKYRYRIDVERGLPLDGRLFARLVHETLNDPRSWGHGGAMTFERVSSGDPDFVITLASPGTTDVWCAKSGLDTSIDKVSCDSASTERVMINAFRWARGADTFGDDMLAYRRMLINHEVGHRLGHNHEGCPADGALAPVMMQQTKFLTTGGATCRPNPWPFPEAAPGGGGTDGTASP